MNNIGLTTAQNVIDVLTASIRAEVLAEQSERRQQPQRRLLTVHQAADYLGRSDAAVRQLIHKKVLPVVRFDRAVRIDVRDLDRLIDEYRV